MAHLLARNRDKEKEKEKEKEVRDKEWEGVSLSSSLSGVPVLAVAAVAGTMASPPLHLHGHAHLRQHSHDGALTSTSTALSPVELELQSSALVSEGVQALAGQMARHDVKAVLRELKSEPRAVLSARWSDEWTALHLAVAVAQSSKLVQALLLLEEARWDFLNAVDGHGRSALQLAVVSGQAELVRLLLADKRIDVKRGDDAAQPLLHLCARHCPALADDALALLLAVSFLFFSSFFSSSSL